MLQKAYVLGDLHNNYKGLMQLFEKVNFNPKYDTLYFIGDLFEGSAKDSYECLNELSKITNLHACMGNHDLWVKEWITNNRINKSWLKAGGAVTIDSLQKKDNHLELLNQYFTKVKYWFNYKEYFLCHAGFDTRKSVISQKEINFAINRSLWQKALVADSQNKKLKFNFNNVPFDFQKVIIGHTPTTSHKPEILSNIINIDTGSGSVGRLTLMDLNTHEYYQSDLIKKLYKL